MDVRTYDDRDGLIWFGGELIDWRDARVHVLTHGIAAIGPWRFEVGALTK